MRECVDLPFQWGDISIQTLLGFFFVKEWLSYKYFHIEPHRWKWDLFANKEGAETTHTKRLDMNPQTVMPLT